MNDLEKALRCNQLYSDSLCKSFGDISYGCRTCEFWQTKYLNDDMVMEAAIERIHELEKSNRNWRRKVQRLRKELKEVKHEG